MQNMPRTTAFELTSSAPPRRQICPAVERRLSIATGQAAEKLLLRDDVPCSAMVVHCEVLLVSHGGGPDSALHECARPLPPERSRE